MTSLFGIHRFHHDKAQNLRRYVGMKFNGGTGKKEDVSYRTVNNQAPLWMDNKENYTWVNVHVKSCGL
jgi:hypothetical protein